MNTNKKRIIFISTGCALVATAMSLTLVLRHKSFNLSFAGDSSYSLTLNRAITSSELAAGEAVFDTANGNPIQFNFDSASSGQVITLATGGYLYNETALTGISKIELTLSGGSATLFYGNAKDALYAGSQVLDTESGNEVPFTINLEHKSDYFKISDVTGPFEINYFKLTYSCSNDYAYDDQIETDSGDILYTAVPYNDLDGEHNTLDSRSHETSGPHSGYAYKVGADTEAGGWPSVLFAFDKNYNITDANLTIKAKFVTEGASANKWLSVKLYNSAWQQAVDEIGMDFIGSEGEWLEATISNQAIKDHLIGGFDLAEIGLARIHFDFETNKGHEQTVWFDELHFNDIPSLGKNLEMCSMDTGLVMSLNSDASVTYSQVYGNSVSARKITFANSDVSTGVGRCSFSPEADGLSGIDVKNTTMTFDIMLSDEFFESEADNKHMFSLDLISHDWQAKNEWHNYDYRGGAGFGPAFTDNGWYHVSIDISQVANYASLQDDLIRIRFDFFGLTDETKAGAWVVIDNLCFTPNA